MRDVTEARDRYMSDVGTTSMWTKHDVPELLLGAQPRIAPPEMQYGIADLSAIVDPLLEHARTRLRDEAHLSGADAALSCPADDIFIHSLRSTVSRLIRRTLVLELNVARLRGHLRGATPADRFTAFVDLLQTPEYRASLLKEYPVLFERIAIAIQQWYAATREFLLHLVQDYDNIATDFGISGRLTRITVTGDRHNGGRSVLLVNFADGSVAVYKPRSLAVDAAFALFVEWLNEQCGPSLELQFPKHINRGDHGWVEFIKARACDSRQDLRRFYCRQGAWLAVFHIFRGVDFHEQNFVANCDNPIPIDIETLFHPVLPGEHDAVEGAPALAYQSIRDSVLRIGMLPTNFSVLVGADAADRSALGGGIERNTISYPGALELQNAGTDLMQYVPGNVSLPKSLNRPILDGIAQDPAEWLDEIIAGFTLVFRVAQTHNTAITRMLSRCANCSTRVLVRSTESYSHFLHDSEHPDRMRKTVDRDILFDRLISVGGNFAKKDRLLAIERAALVRNDIPYFSTRPNSRDLWSDGKQVVKHYSPASGLSSAQRILLQLNEQELERQIWFIRASLSKGTLAEPQCIPLGPDRFTPTQTLLATAVAIGDRLIRCAFRADDSIAWLGLTVDEDAVKIGVTDINLYGGLSGIALFFAQLARISHEDRFQNIAKFIVAQIRRDLPGHDGVLGPQSPIGVFDGYGGIIYMMHYLGKLWCDPTLIADAQKLAAWLADAVKDDTRLDVISGVAGLTVVLTDLFTTTHSREILELLMSCATRLCDTCCYRSTGITWATRIECSQPLTGASHGASGMAWALAHVATVTDDRDLLKFVCGALDYEWSVFSPESHNWPTFIQNSRASTSNIVPSFKWTWCHGAPGIGLVRLDIFRLLRSTLDERLHRDIDLAVTSSFEHRRSWNHSLCHGECGIADLFVELAASATMRRFIPNAPGLSQQVIQELINGILHDGVSCGVPNRLETPGLMVGMAGIGYGLLRLALPDQVPSILLLRT